MLNELAKEVYNIAKAHGWHEEDRGFPEIVALCHSELSEALEEYRNGRPNKWYACEEIFGSGNPCDPKDQYECANYSFKDKCKYRSAKPEGIAVEMADCIIRILDWCGKEKIDIDSIIREKINFNQTRPYRHGGKKA